MTRLPFTDIYIRMTVNIKEHAINPLANFATFAEFAVFDCVLLGAILVCVLDPDPLCVVLVLFTIAVVEVVAELEVDTTAEVDVLVFVDDTSAFEIAATAVPSTKPQEGATGPAVALAHTPITH
jgi:hypothetical protein